MSASPRRVAAALIVTLLGSPLRGQSSADSGTAASSQQRVSSPASARPSIELGVDRPVIDAATIVRERGALSLTDVLMSRVAGLHVIPGPGVNGSGSRIRLRGVQSLVADRAPLVLVDGMRVDAAEDAFSPTVPQGFPLAQLGSLAPGPLRLEDLDMEDVDSIEVLPGPASAAVYGPGAGGGVLLVHTKRGRPGPPRWEGYAQGGVSTDAVRWPANFGGVDSDNATLQRGSCTLSFQAQGLCVQDFVQQFNPLEQRSPFRTALRRQYGLTVSGGSGWGDYRLAGGYEGAGGAYSSRVTSPDPNYYRRLNGRASVWIRPWSTVELGANVARMSSDLRLPPNILQQAGVFGPSDSAGFDWDGMFRLKSTQVTLSLWGNRNRLTKLDAPFFFGTGLVLAQRAVSGYPVGGYWTLPVRSFADANGDGIIAPSEVSVGQRVWVGTPYPTQGALVTSEWMLGGMFRAALTLDYRAGHHLLNEVAFERCLSVVCRAANDPRTPLADQARAVVTDVPTSGYFEDADYLKLREVSLTWYAPPSVAAALRARAATVRVAGRDVMTWTGYSGADPEAGSYGVLGYGVPRTIADIANLPVPHSWTLRVQLTY